MRRQRYHLSQAQTGRLCTVLQEHNGDISNARAMDAVGGSHGNPAIARYWRRKLGLPAYVKPQLPWHLVDWETQSTAEIARQLNTTLSQVSRRRRKDAPWTIDEPAEDRP